MRGPREIAFHGCEQLDGDMAECDVKASSLRAAIMDDMSAEASGKDFVLTIIDVFSITGRGTAVIGPIESGVIRTGEIVEVWDGNQLITTARATVELICNRRADPRSIGLMLGDVDKSLLRTGQTIRKPAMTT